MYPVQAGDNITIRDNELENCSNGIFTMSQEYNEAHLTRNILIEHNYLHGHGQPNSGRQHSLYIQAIGATYQFNLFGANDPQSLGTTLKERVAGSVIRYNWFSGGSSRALDLVEVEDAAPWYIEQEYRRWAQEWGEDIDNARLSLVRDAESRYRKTHVYGNFFQHIGNSSVAGSLVHYGWDNDPALARKGVLYFYNNTVSILQDRSDSWRFRLFDMRLYKEDPPVVHSQEKIEAFNNIIYFASQTPAQESAYMCMSNNSGTVDLGVNWISQGWQSSEAFRECYPYAGENPIVNGAENVITSADNSSPVDLTTLLPQDSVLRDKAQSVPVGNEVVYQYVRDVGMIVRSESRDLGAAELP